MSILTLHHASIVVNDLDAAITFFTELGMELEGQASVEGETVDRLCGLNGIQSDIAMVKTPDGLHRLELTRYQRPPAISAGPPNAPANTLGLRSIMFQVTDIDATMNRMLARGVELVGEPVQFENSYRLCYLRGPEGIIVALSEAIG